MGKGEYVIELKIEQTMRRKGFNAKMLAAETGIRYTVLTPMLRGETKPNLEYLSAIAEVLGVSDVRDLIDFKERKDKKKSKWY